MFSHCLSKSLLTDHGLTMYKLFTPSLPRIALLLSQFYFTILDGSGLGLHKAQSKHSILFETTVNEMGWKFKYENEYFTIPLALNS